MITEKLQKEFNEQITAELWSSQLYLQMAFFLKKEGWNGFAHWMEKQSEEERGHACSMADFVIKRGGEVKLQMIDVVPCGWGSVLEVVEHVAEHERHVSKLIDDLVAVAHDEKDNAAQDFLWGFVREQVEEEAIADALVAKVKHAGEAGLACIDAELAKR